MYESSSAMYRYNWSNTNTLMVDLMQAAERALGDLKALPTTSEAQLASGMYPLMVHPKAYGLIAKEICLDDRASSGHF